VRARSTARSRARFPAQRARAIEQHFSKCSKPRFHKGFCDIIKHMGTSLQIAECHAINTADASPRALGARGIAREKKFGKMPSREHLGRPNPTRIERIARK
jgi:hypothetical protein